jgi:two-component system cell cycle sensor histidine kinase/response regulator CckA
MLGPCAASREHNTKPGGGVSKSSSAFAAEQRLLLERTANGAPLDSVLSELVRMVERQAYGMLGSILLVDNEHGTVHPIAAPSLPTDFTRALEGAKIGPTAGSCGAAAFLKERVIVGDIATHANWVDYRELALAHHLRACWSTPILTVDRKVVGTFAMYYSEPREPTSIEIAWVDAATHVAAIAILLAGYERMQQAAHAAEIERRSLEQRLIEAERLKGLGTLAAGIAHDFNNILTAVRGHTELALMHTQGSPAARQSLEEVRSACSRAAKLVRQIVSFGQRDASHREAVSLRAVVDEAVGLIESTLPPAIDLRTCFAPGECPIWADETQVHQVLMNVAGNAIAAMNTRAGEIEIALDDIELDDTHRQIDLARGRYARLRIKDEGCGMSPETLARAFDPFFTTKPVGEGTGLGLSVVHGIMKSHEGAVAVSSEMGRGTTFELYFPAASTRLANLTSDHTTAHVLYVDDDEGLVELSVRLLRRLGYRATGLSDPRAALTLLRNDAHGFDVVISDTNMPGLSGPDLIREIKELHPHLRTALVSGFTSGGEGCMTDEHIALKPRTQHELAELMQRMLRRRTSQ